MPTRLPVLLHRRKSAAAGPAVAPRTTATSDNPPSAARVPHRFRPVLAGAPSIFVDSAKYWSAVRISLRRSGAVNEDGAEVVDVGEGRPGSEKVAEAREERGGIVFGEKGGRIEAKRATAGAAGAVDEGPGRVIRAPGATIGANGIAGQRRDASRSLERQRQSERI